MLAADPLAALGDRLLRCERRGRPFDRNRIAAHFGRIAAVRDRGCLPVHARFEMAVDRIEEIVAMKLGVKAEDRGAEQSVEDLLAPRADAECFRIWPRDVPEGDDRRARQPLADHAWE